MLLLLLPILAVWLIRRTRLAWTWNPLHWWNDATNLAGGTLDDLKQWVLTVVKTAVNLVWNDTVQVFHFFNFVFHNFITEVEWTFGQVNGYIQGVFRYASALYGQAVGLAENLYNRAVGIAESLVNRAVGFAERLAADIRRDLGAAIGLAEHLASIGLSDVRRWAAAGLNAVEGFARGLVTTALKWTVGQLASLYRTLYGDIKRDFINPIEQILTVVRKAWDWIWWFAEHPFKVVYDAEHDVINWLDHVPERAEHVVLSAQYRRGFDAVGHYFGG